MFWGFNEYLLMANSCVSYQYMTNAFGIHGQVNIHYVEPTCLDIYFNLTSISQVHT